MKQIITTIALMFASIAIINAQTTATNWTAQDCNSVNHTLFTDLDNGKIVVMVWVMPCGSCVNGATAAYNAMQSFATSHPGKVVYYIADDLGDASCSTLSSWITSNSIGSLSNMTVFSNSGNVIKESDFGGSGMPHVAVIGGTNHKIYYNKMNSATNDQAGITSAINWAIAAATGVNAVASQIKFSVSPNPAKENLSITCTKGIKKVSISSLTGQVIKEETFANGKMNPVINLSGVAAGVYTIKVTDMAGQAGIQKIVKE
jgi:hypothetical protein